MRRKQERRPGGTIWTGRSVRLRAGRPSFRPACVAPLPLFAGFDAGELARLEQALSLAVSYAQQGELLLRADDPASVPGYLLSGKARAFFTDYWGHRSILSHLRPGDLFGEAALLLSAPLPVNVTALGSCTVLFLDPRPIRRPEGDDAALLERLRGRAGEALARANLLLLQKLDILSRRTTRDKAMAYLSQEAARAGSSSFRIPFTRDELADYLCVNCSALSTELSKLQQEGWIRFTRDRFQLLRRDF